MSSTLTDGYIKFSARNFGYAGDKATWARYDAKSSQLTVAKAAKGTISSAYNNELTAFCADYGVDFAALGYGQRITVTL